MAGINRSYEAFDFAKDQAPESVTINEVYVTVDPTQNMKELGSAFDRDLQRRDPLLYQAIEEQVSKDPILSGHSFSDWLKTYAESCLFLRMEKISNGRVKVWNEAKNLLIPPIIQAVISSVGKFFVEGTGDLLIPKLKDGIEASYDIGILLRISYYLKAFKERANVAMDDAAFPTKDYVVDGDVMMHTLKKAYPNEGEIQVFGVTRVSPTNMAFIAYLLYLESSIPDWYRYPILRTSRCEYLCRRFL